MKRCYLVTITETLSRTVKVYAENKVEAEDMVEDAYRPPRCEIILDSEDYDGVDFEAREVEDEDLGLYKEVKVAD